MWAPTGVAVTHLLAGFAAAALLAAVVSAQGPPQGRGAPAPQGPPSPAAQKHIDAARAAAGAEHAVLVDKLCGRAGPTQSTERAQPQRVFDNFYFVGMAEFTAWAVTTSQGIIVIDPVYDYSVEDTVVGGLQKLGLNPADIKYVLVSHGHLDHAGGAKLLQERYGARVLLAAADWDLLDRQNPTWKPKRDMIVTDGQQLTLGDTTLTMYLTPGHTPGTISTVIPLRDGARRHVAALWGGTLFNFGPNRVAFESYRDSAARFREVAAKAGADVLLSNHSEYDGTKTKLPALATRAPGSVHPYVVGTRSIQNYLTVANECAQAAIASLGTP
jgi:metallo-beta-lactamase class B